MTSPGRGDLLAVAHASPFHGQTMAGFVLAGVLSLIVLVTGAVAASVLLVAWGAGAVLVVTAAALLFWKTAPTRDALRVYSTGIDFLRGHRRGWLPLEDITGAGGVEWGGSIYPYARRARFLILQTTDGDWEIGPQVAGHEAIQELVLRLLSERSEASR